MSEQLETATCVVCGAVVPLAKSRLFWMRGGTYRTCQRGDMPHDPPRRVRPRKEASHVR